MESQQRGVDPFPQPRRIHSAAASYRLPERVKLEAQLEHLVAWHGDASSGTRPQPRASQRPATASVTAAPISGIRDLRRVTRPASAVVTADPVVTLHAELHLPPPTLALMPHRNCGTSMVDIAVRMSPLTTSSASSGSNVSGEANTPADAPPTNATPGSSTGATPDESIHLSLDEMKLEIQVMELRDTLKHLQERRRQLEQHLVHHAGRTATLQSEQSSRVDSYLHDIRVGGLAAELAADLEADRARRKEAAQRARREVLGEGAANVASPHASKKQLFKPKAASPWASMHVAPISDDDGAAPRPRSVKPPTSLLASTLPLDGISSSSSSLKVADGDEREPALNHPLAGLSIAQQAEIMKMRTLAVERCHLTEEPASRRRVEEAADVMRRAMMRVWEEGMLEECRCRLRIVANEAADRSHLIHYAASSHHRAEVSMWTGDVFADRKHLLERAAAEVAPEEARCAALEAATEAHRHDIRKQWERATELRESVLQCVQQRTALRQQLRSLQQRHSPAPMVGYSPSAAVAPERVGRRVNREDLEAIVREQRMAVIEEQLRSVGEREAKLQASLRSISLVTW